MSRSNHVVCGFAPVCGAELYYEIAGSGFPIVLIHARLADSRMWDALWETLTAHARVIRYDLRGYGRSNMPAGPYSHIEDLAGLLAFLSISAPCVVGSSMGGEIALDFALQHPGRLSALILAGCAPGGYTWSSELQPAWAAIFAALEQGDFEHAVELDLQLWVDGPYRQPGDVDSTIREAVRAMDLANWKKLAEYRHYAHPSPPAAPAAVTRLHEVGAPTCVMVGSLDLPDILKSAHFLATGITQAEKVVVDGAGHMLVMEQPDYVARLVRQVVDRHA